MRTEMVRVLVVGAFLTLTACARAPDGQSVPASGTAAAPPAAVVEPVVEPAGEAAVPPASTGPRPGGVGPGAGVRVFIDPVTGEARAPTRAEVAAAAADSADRVRAAGGISQAASEDAQREHFVLPDGTEGVKLLPRDRHAVVVCRQSDGSYGGDCPRPSGAAAP
ncbi:MAG: hypothetical protein IT480_05430 [Gammaproteobacteria bacterium]|nr:hypothetical protein [Gammaproteobacteria bacterium]